MPAPKETEHPKVETECSVVCIKLA